MKTSICFLLLLLVFAGETVDAQDRYRFMDHLTLSVEASTAGAGLQIATPIHPQWALRAGVNAISFDFTYNHDEGLVPLTTDSKAKLYNGNILFDWYPKVDGLFHVTSGLYIGSSTSDGVSRSAHTYTIAGYVFPPEYFGTAKSTVKAAVIKPYLGIGFGRSVPNSRISFKLDLGGMYHGSPNIDVQNNSLFYSIVGNLPKLQDNVSKFKVYPVLSVQLVYKLH